MINPGQLPQLGAVDQSDRGFHLCSCPGSFTGSEVKELCYQCYRNITTDKQVWIL
jgi:hypothetical protein